MYTRHGTRTGDVSTELVRRSDVNAAKSSQNPPMTTTQRLRLCRKRTSG